MKGPILTILVMLFFALGSTADEDLSSLYREFKVSTYEVKNLWLSGGDFFSAHKIGDYYTISSYSSGGMSWLRQSPNAAWGLDEEASFHVHKGETAGYDARICNVLHGEAHVYLTGYQGVFLEGRTSTHYDSRGDDYAYCGAGLGIGRITEVTPIAQAIAASELVFSGSTGMLSREVVLDVAEMIDKEYAYIRDFRDDWEERFYGDLGEVLQSHGAAALSLGQVLRLREVLSGYTYRVSPRQIGWEFSLEYESSLRYDGVLRGESGALNAQLEYARPISLDKQFSTMIFSSLGLGETDLRALSRVSYTIDHTYHWTSYAKGEVRIDAPEGESAVNTYEIMLGSRYGITNRLWSHVGTSVGKDPWTEGVRLGIHGGFTYYVL